MGQINYSKLNQDIYDLNNNISRNDEMVFVATLVIVICSNSENKKPGKLIDKIQFMPNEDGSLSKPIDQLVEMAKKYVEKLGLASKTKDAVFSSLNSICDSNTHLDYSRTDLKKFIDDFVDNVFPYIDSQELFFEHLYMAIDKKASKSDRGIILTPLFMADFMVELLDLDYRNDVVADLCAGTGLFSIRAYSKMLDDLNSDRNSGKITKDEYDKYLFRLSNSIIANDKETKMVTVCLANFLLKSIDTRLLFNDNCLSLEKSSFRIDEDNKAQPTKAILNPPYEDTNKPLEIILKNIELVKQSGTQGHKVVVIVPPQKFGQKKEIFSKMLSLATLTCVVKTQEGLFRESGKAQTASVLVFDTSRGHISDDLIHYYNFTDTGFVYLKDSGLVDKNHTYEQKKADLLKKIRIAESNKSPNQESTLSKRAWENFYDVNMDSETVAKIDPDKVKVNSEEADVTFENITLKKALDEKNALLESVDNSYVDSNGDFEKYILDILSEVD